jgi:O-antigen/teichoic acid export membrane protein
LSNPSSHTSKLIKRAFASGLNAARSLLPAFVNFVMAYLVISNYSQALWGGFVNDLIFITLSISLLSWGNKEYLLREFSKTPTKIEQLWKTALASRMVLLLLPLALIFILFEQELWAPLSLWLLGAFLFQALDVLVIYHRKFRWAIVTEFIAFVFLLVFLKISESSLSIVHIVWAFALANISKFVLLVPAFKKVFSQKGGFTFSGAFFMAALPFLLIGLSGLLQSKTDLYIVNFFEAKSDVGVYQVVINVFIYMQAFAGFALVPFSKNLYRLSRAKMLRLSIRFFALGMAFLCLAVPAAYALLNGLYDFNLSFDFYVYGVLLVMPCFYYLPIIHLLLGQRKEKQVMYINFAGAIVNLVLTITLVQVLSIKGALIGSAVAQWVMLFCYLYLINQLKNDSLPEENSRN